MRKGKAADAHDAGVVGLPFVRARQLLLMIWGCWVGMRIGKAADAHDAGDAGLECVRARQLMLMMLGLLGWNG